MARERRPCAGECAGIGARALRPVDAEVVRAVVPEAAGWRSQAFVQWTRRTVLGGAKRRLG